MAWSEFAITPPGTVTAIKTLFETLQSGLETMLNYAKAQAALAKVLADGPNAQLLALEATMDEILADIEALQVGGLSGIIAHPYAEGIVAKYDRVLYSMMLSPSSALIQVNQAFDDEGDLKRPTGVGNWGGIVIVGACIGFEGFYPLLNALGNFFSLEDLKALGKQLEKRWQTIDTGVKPEVKLSSGLDFFGVTQAELFPTYNAMLERIKRYALGAKQAIISASGSLDDIMAFIDSQLQELIDIVDLIDAYLASFIFNLEGSGVHYQVFPKDSNTIESIKTGLMADYPVAWGSQPYSVVFGLFGSDAGIEKLSSFMGL
ncbi:hypothetical protein KKI24_28925 [bacterium]|nr:hypothetical protein [bacterium]